MGLLSADTTPEAEKVQFEIYRSMGALGRLRLVASSILECWTLAKKSATADPTRRWLGQAPPKELERSLTPMQPLQTPLRLARILTSLRLNYVIGGSYASSLHGEPRATRDCDFLTDIGLDDLDSLEQAVKDEFYISRSAADEAVRLKRCFNLIHLKTGFKVDIFVSEGRDFDKERLSRALPIELDGQVLNFSTAEDTILAKLEWNSLNSTEQQQRDILGILLLQGDKLDFGYLKHWAQDLGLKASLEELLAKVGLL